MENSIAFGLSSATWRKLRRGTLGVAAAALLMTMMVVTSVDVIGRYLFNSPLSGAFEMTELMLAALVFIGLPLATYRDEHINVDLLDAIMPEKVIRSQQIVMSWLSALVMVILSYQLWHKALSLQADGSVTNTIEIPLAPFAYLMSVTCLVSAIVMVAQGVTLVWNIFTVPSAPED